MASWLAAAGTVSTLSVAFGASLEGSEGSGG